MCEPTYFAIQPRRVSEIQVADRVCEPASRFNTGVFKQGIANQMRRSVKRIAKAQVYIGLPEIDG
jgi:hypothetical protein